MSRDVRTDLRDAHTASLRHIAAPGARFDGERRVQIAQVAIAAYLDPEPPPPWVRPFGDPVLDVAHRLARHAGTITLGWYEEMVGEGLHPLDWVEIVGVVVAALPPVAFARAVGNPLPVLPLPLPGAPTGQEADELAPSALNWVPVAAPADRASAVEQALSALPDEHVNLWRLAAVQYMANDDMGDPRWTRGTLSRPQIELVAGRLSLLRECFF